MHREGDDVLKRWLPGLAAAAAVAVALAATSLAGEAGAPAPRATAESGWQPMSPSPLSPRLNPVLTGWGERVVVLGGDPHSRPCPPGAGCVGPERPAPRDAALYDVSRDRWERLPDAPLPLDVQSTAVLDDVLYVWLRTSDALSLDLTARTWAQLPGPPAPVPCCVRLVSAGDRVVAAPMELREGARDVAWVPARGSWEPLPPSPLDPAYDRTTVWTGQELVLVTAAVPSSDPPFVRAAALRDGRWRLLPEQEVVIGGWPEWSWTGVRLVVATTQRADGGQTNGFGRSIPSGGYLDPVTAGWSELPEAPEVPYMRGPAAAAGRWVANGEGLVLDTVQERWHVLPPYEHQPDQDAGAAWAGGRLVVWGGAVGMAKEVGDPPGRSVATGAVWTPPQG